MGYWIGIRLLIGKSTTRLPDSQLPIPSRAYSIVPLMRSISSRTSRSATATRCRRRSRGRPDRTAARARAGHLFDRLAPKVRRERRPTSAADGDGAATGAVAGQPPGRSGVSVCCSAASSGQNASASGGNAAGLGGSDVGRQPRRGSHGEAVAAPAGPTAESDRANRDPTAPGQDDAREPCRLIGAVPVASATRGWFRRGRRRCGRRTEVRERRVEPIEVIVQLAASECHCLCDRWTLGCDQVPLSDGG